jgi:hypothetical protein
MPGLDIGGGEALQAHLAQKRFGLCMFRKNPLAGISLALALGADQDRPNDQLGGSPCSPRAFGP